MINAGEECDDGNTNDQDHCSNACETRWNVLLIIADDMGQENLQTYQDAIPELAAFTPVVNPATTPTINTIAASGVTFQNAWSNPSCTPTRAGIYSGFHVFQHGLSNPECVAINTGDCADDTSTTGCLSQSLEQTLEDNLAGAPALPGVLPSFYTKGLFGKWHVGGDCNDGYTYDTAKELGWNYVVGSFEAIKDTGDPPASFGDYCSWPQNVIDGVLQTTDTTTYPTLYVRQEAEAWIGTQTSPWYATVAFNVPHEPLHDPSSLTCSEVGCSGVGARGCYRAMIEDMDSEMGLLIDYLETSGELAHTIVIFVGDNGTNSDVYDGATHVDPYGATHAKGTVYQGGVAVPMIVADGCDLVGGAICTRLVVVPDRVSPALVHTIDLFDTIREITGGTDSYVRATESMLPYLTDPGTDPVRVTLYTESESNCAIRGPRYKLVLDDGDHDTSDCNAAATECKLYDLQADPLETTDLLTSTITTSQNLALEALEDALGTLRGWDPPACTVTVYCPDFDLDTYANCTVAGCDTTGLTCGDCNDANSAVYPGIAETCGDLDDHNCNGTIDCNETASCPAGAPLPGEVANLRILADRVTLTWFAEPGSSRYDVLRGSLTALKTNRDFRDAGCMVDEVAATSYADGAPVIPGGIYYLVRGIAGVPASCRRGTYGTALRDNTGRSCP